MRIITRRITGSIVLSLIIVTAVLIQAGCSSKPEPPAVSPVYGSYRDIPAITQAEIDAIEALKTNRSAFVYGMEHSAECFALEGGGIGGFAALYCEWLSRLFGIAFEPVIFDWDELINGLETGAIDFTGDLTPTEERRNTYFMTDYIASRSVKIMRLVDTESFENLPHYGKPRYVFINGAVTYGQVLPFLSEPFDVVFADSHTEVYEILKSGRADVFFEESPYEAAFDVYGDIVAEQFFPLIYTPVSFTTQNLELEPVISVIQKALDDGATRYLTALYNQGNRMYLRNKFVSGLTDAEKAYIDAHNENGVPIPIGLEFDNYPISFYNYQEHEWQGNALDVLREIETLSGLSFAIAHDEPLDFSELLRLMETGEIVLLSEVIPTIERQGRFLWPEPYATDKYALVSLMDFKDIEYNEILYLTVGLQTDTAYAEVFREWFPDHRNIVEYTDTISGLDGLERGEIDAFMGTMKLLLSATNYMEKPGHKSNIVFNRTYYSTFGISVSEPELCSIIDKAQKLIDMKTINDRWTTRVFDYRSAAARARMPYLIGLSIALLGVVALLAVLFLKSKRANAALDAAVRDKTRELKTQMEIAVSASEAKSRFLATTSHEIRTPLNTVLGIAQIQMQDEELPPKYASAFEKINDSGSALLGIINDILDLSKIETGKMELNPAEYDVAELINSAAKLNAVRIGTKPIKFILETDESLPSRLYGDELRLKQILNNLLSNAAKYTEKGYIKLSVSHSQTGEDIRLIFAVEDTGQGMKPENCERLFSEDYLRFNTAANRTTEGTGLGLNITKKLIELMDGEITVKSEYGKGSVFTVNVVQKPVADRAPIGAKTAASLRDFTYSSVRYKERRRTIRNPMPYGKVLVVDDVESNLLVAEGLLSPYRLNIQTADSGFKALEILERGEVFDIIFMDHMMPVMDGIETARRIRELGYTGVIVALTANALVGNDETFSRCGFDGFITKPIDIRRLDATLNKFIRDKYPAEAEKYKLQIIEPAEDAGISPKIAKAFRRAAAKAAATLKESIPAADSDAALFTTTVHGMKSALANIGERDAAQAAADLEKAGLGGDTGFIRANAQAFIETLERLAEELRSVAESEDNVGATDITEDTEFLIEQLTAVTTACGDYDDTSALAALDLLKSKAWKKETADTLEQIRDAIYLDSDFEEAADKANTLVKSRREGKS